MRTLLMPAHSRVRVLYQSIAQLLVAIFLATGLIAIQSAITAEPAHAANPTCASGMSAQYGNVSNTAGYTAVPSHGQVFYIDSGVSPKLDAAYVGYKITNNIGATGSKKTFWVSLESFTGGKVSLANPKDQFQEIDNLAKGSSATAFFLLKATGATTTAQVHTVKIYETRPDIQGATAQLTCDFKFTKVAETIKASANKIGRVQGALSGGTATLGGTYTVTIDTQGGNQTQTGTLGSGSAPDYGAFWASPAAYSSWPTRALRLEETSITITCQSGSLTLTNELFISDGASGTALKNCIKSGQGSNWTATYTFRIIGPAAAGLAPSPVAIISSGTQYKHSPLGLGIGSNTTVDLSGVNSASSASISVSGAKETASSAAAGNVRIKYTVTVSTTATSAIQVDEIVDTHDQGAAVYVASTTSNKLGTATAISGPEPNYLAADSALAPPPYHFVGPFSGIDSTHSQYLYYDFDIPCGVANYKTTVVGYTGDVIIGSASATASTITIDSTNCSNPTITQGTVTLDPTALTNPATSVSDASATLNGAFNANNTSGTAGTTYKFTYGKDPNLVSGNSTTTATAISGSNNSLAAVSISGLTASTKYYFQASITNASKTVTGSILSFTTTAVVGAPIVRTDAATAVTQTTATLNGAIDPNGTAIGFLADGTTASGGVYFYYGTSSAMNATNTSTLNSYTALQVKIDGGAGTLTNLNFSANTWGENPINSNNGLDGSQQLTGLTPATTYYYQVHITCTYSATTNPQCPSSGFIDGKVLSFTTGAPIATTQPASLISESSATLNGDVNANGAGATANITYCYSLSNTLSTTTIGKLDSCTAATSSPTSATGTATASSSAAISGLLHGTVYYFQVIAQLGTTSTYSYGSVLSFQTLDITSPVSLTLTSGATGQFYQNSFGGVGGSGGYQWSTSSTLPTGISLNSNGVISGTPSQSGTFSITIVMTDTTTGGTSSETYSLTIAGPPTATTTAATSVASTKATLNGTINPNALQVSAANFCWGSNSGLGGCTSVSISTTGLSDSTVHNVSAVISGLTANTQYWFKVSATSTAGTTESNTSNFTTASASTASASSVSISGAVLNGNVSAPTTAIANGEIQNLALCYSQSDSVDSITGFLNNSQTCSNNLWTGTSTVSAGNTLAVNSTVTGLTANTLYYSQVKVTFTNGATAKGSVVSFTTMNNPDAVVSPATRVTSKGAIIHGLVNPKTNRLTKVSFCLSRSPITDYASCGTESEADNIDYSATWNGASGNKAVDKVLANLLPGTTYYYVVNAYSGNFSPAALRARIATLRLFGAGQNLVRVKTAAASSTPTVYSSSSSFTTAGAVTDDPTNIRSTTATINGTLNSSSSGFGATDVSSVFICYSDTDAVDANGAFTSANASCGNNLWAGTSVAGSTPTAYSRNLTGLTPGATYYTRIMTTFYDNSTANGVIKSWVSPLPPTPLATSATSITHNSAIINGTVNANNSPLSDVSFCWDTSTAFTNCSTNTIVLSAPAGGWTLNNNSISTTLSGLQANTTYYFKVMATNSVGSNTSSYEQFTTKSIYTFDSRSGSAVSPVYFVGGSTISAPTDPTRDGYSFAGWFTDPSVGTQVTFPVNNQPAGNVTVYAHWSAIDYVVSYNLHSGTRDTGVTQTSTYNIGGSIINPGTPTRTGYQFNGWFLDAVGGTALTFPYAPSPSRDITLHAQWTQQSYDVLYNDGGAPGSVPNDTYVYGGSVTLPAAPTYDGYHFDGWFASLSDTTPLGSSYSPPGTGTITIYAKWTIYSVTYDNGSSTTGVPASTTGVVNSLPSQGTMVDPSGNGGTFAGWSCPTGSATLAAGATFVPTSNVICTAVWTPLNSKTLTYNSNYPGGTLTAATATQSNNTSATLQTVNFAKTGYTLIGWDITPTGGTTTRYSLTGTYNFAADAVAQAVWQQDSYAVIYDEQSGSSVADDSFVYGGSVTLPSTTRAGYDFLGWYDDPTTGSRIGSANSSYSPPGTSAITLYAHWSRTVYTVTFHSNYPSGSNTTETQTGNATAALRGNTFSVNGYTFSTWSTVSTATGGTTYGDGVNYDFLAPADLYARWTPNSNTVIFDPQNGGPTTSGTYLSGGSISRPTNPSYTGYTFLGWTTQQSSTNYLSFPYSPGTIGTITLYGQWTADSNLVHFNSQGGSDVPDGSYFTGGNIAAPSTTPTKAGSELLGWFANSSNGTALSFPYNPNTTGTVTLYAQWRKWVVSFALGDGGGTPATGTPPADLDGVITLPSQGSMVAPNGYQFTGWRCAGGATVYTAGTSITPTGNTTCTAVWSLITTKTVTFHSNYPAGTNTTTVQTSSSQANLNPNPFVAGGFTFAGWSLTPGGAKAYDNQASFSFNANTDLYAIWTAVSSGGGTPAVQIIYVYQGGTPGVTVTYYTIGAPPVVLPTTEKPGYTFSGWSTSAIGPNLVDPLFTTTQNVTLYAIWKPKTVTVTFNYQGGTQGVRSVNYIVGSPAIRLPSTKKDNFGFGGWSETKGGSYAVDNPYMPLTDTTLYAIWNGTQYTLTLMPLSPAPPIKLTYTVGGPALTLPSQIHGTYQFQGWSAKQNATTGQTGKFRPSGDLTMWTVWKDIPASTNVFFGGDSPVLTTKAKTKLQALSKLVLKAKQRPQMIVNGWVKETADTSYDTKLSNDRAVNAANYLRKLGVDAVVSLTPKGIAPEKDASARRTEISVFYSGKSITKNT